MEEQTKVPGNSQGAAAFSQAIPAYSLFDSTSVGLATFLGTPAACAALMALNYRRMGRLLLGRLSREVVRNHWLSKAARENVDSLKLELEKRPNLTFGLFLFYAFTPLPSNYLFIAYGLTTMPLARLVAPFLIGRFVSYSFWTMSAAAVSRKLQLEETDAIAYFSVYFVLTQLALLAVVYAFTRVDWNLLLRKRKWKWLSKSAPDAKRSS